MAEVLGGVPVVHVENVEAGVGTRILLDCHNLGSVNLIVGQVPGDNTVALHWVLRELRQRLLKSKILVHRKITHKIIDIP